MSTESEVFVTLPFANGKSELARVLRAFTVDGQDYLAVCAPPDSEEILLFMYDIAGGGKIGDEDVDIDISNIPESDFAGVAQAFEDLLSTEIDDDDYSP